MTVDSFTYGVIHWIFIDSISDSIGETDLVTMKQGLKIFLSCWSRFICYFCKCMGPQRRSVCCNFHYLSSLVLRVWERYVEDEKERKQEIAKNAKDDGEKKERGGGREGLSAERRFKVCKLANKSKGEVGLWILDFGILFTGWQLRQHGDNSFTTLHER